MSKKSSASFPLASVLLVLFIALKLCHVINWSWWWVMSPLWISVVVALIGVIVMVIFSNKKD